MCAMTGRSSTGTIGFGISNVSGRRRVPRPAARTMAFMRRVNLAESARGLENARDDHDDDDDQDDQPDDSQSESGERWCEYESHAVPFVVEYPHYPVVRLFSAKSTDRHAARPSACRARPPLSRA